MVKNNLGTQRIWSLSGNQPILISKRLVQQFSTAHHWLYWTICSCNESQRTYTILLIF